MDFDELANLIKTRRTIRSWQEKDVPEQLLVQAVELATWAPNAGNGQNWYFHIILKKDVLNAIAEAVAAGESSIMSWPEMAQIREGIPPTQPNVRTGPARRASQSKVIARAPALIAISTKRIVNPMEKVLIAREKVDAKARQMLQVNAILDMRIQSVSAAIMQLLLILHQMGLGAAWLVNPVEQAKEEIERILNVPAESDVIAFIPVGYPAETPVRTRKPVNEVCQVIK
jgi:nitroreductase